MEKNYTVGEKMKIGELIQKLSRFDPELTVLIDNNRGDFRPLPRETDIIPVEYGFDGSPENKKVLLVLPCIKEFR